MNETPPRPTLEQLAAAAAGTDPWECRHCGCRHWAVVSSYERGGARRRVRACRHCKRTIQTYELPAPKGGRVVVVEPPPEPPAETPAEPPPAGTPKKGRKKTRAATRNTRRKKT